MKIDHVLNFASRKVSVLVFCLFWSTLLLAQKQQKPDPAIAEATDFVAEGNDEFESKEFALAEASYRKAIAKDAASVPAKYNMGNNYYRNKKYEEGMSRYLQAAEIAETKAQKHQAFHNLGNAYYQQKDYKKAVEAYKNALRNNPTDDETRYNLALAKKEDEKNGGGGGGDDNKENEDQNQDQDQKNEGDDGKEKESDDGKPKESDDHEEKKEGEDKKDDQGKPEDQEGDNKNPGENNEQQPQQPQQGQLSPQQVKSLLEAMKNEENKVQDKINAQRVKGAKVKTEKDW